MKLIIDIPNDLYEKISKSTENWAARYVEGWDITVARIIRNGTPYEERPHGEWEILKGDYFTGGGDPVLICPFCHSEESKHMGGIEFPVNWDFCPNCGASMERRGDNK